LDDDLRPRFWIHQMPFFSFQNEVREKVGQTDLFDNAYDIILGKIRNENAITEKVINEIGKK